MNEFTVPVRLTHMWRRRGNGVVVVSDANFNLVRYEFNRIGSQVWELVDGQRSLRAIVDEIVAENPSAPFQKVASSVKDFLEHLRAEWLVMTREELATYE